MGRGPKTYRFTLTDRDFARAWLTEYYRRPGWRLLRFGAGPAIVALGWSMTSGPTALTRGMGWVAIAFGVYYALKPLLGCWMMVRRRRASGRSELSLEVQIGSRGVRIDDGKVRTQLGWDQVSSAGRGRDYFWYELRGGARATIPLGAVDDAAELEATLREHTRWQS